VLDCAHGATYQVAPKVFAELGARVEAIGAAPDGLNINDGVGSMHPEAIVERVRASGAALGIAFDGDGDRVQFVDAAGVLHDGDALVYLLARDWQRSGRLRGPVVGTLMTNYALEHALGESGIDFVRVQVGDRFVHQALVEHGGVLGGEASGHLLCLDRASTGDAIVAALQVLEAMQRAGGSLAQALAGYAPLPQKTVNVRIAPGAKPLDRADVQAARAEAEAALEGRGRLVLRPSGTEPVVRVTVEADDAALMQQVLDRLSAVVRAAA
jgi:phosphoglucosamine mutase